MGLHLVDCHLEYARWWLARARGRDVPSERLYDDVREHLAITKQTTEKMGYHRRDKDVQELERQLSQ
jgi:hypothetical protein